MSDFKSEAAGILYDAVNNAYDNISRYSDCVERQKSYYNAVGAAAYGMDVPLKSIREAAFVEFRKSLDPNDIDTVLINNAVDALEARLEERSDPFIDADDGYSEYYDQEVLAFLDDPEHFLDNLEARHDQIVQFSEFLRAGRGSLTDEHYQLAKRQIIASTNAEVLAAKLKTARGGEAATSNYAAIRTAADGSPDAAAPVLERSGHGHTY